MLSEDRLREDRLMEDRLREDRLREDRRREDRRRERINHVFVTFRVEPSTVPGYFRVQSFHACNLLLGYSLLRKKRKSNLRLDNLHCI